MQASATDEQAQATDGQASAAKALPGSIDETLAALQAHHYLADRRLASAVFLALRLGKPLLLEGEPGTGKTEIAKVLASWLGKRLIRLQCYDGMDLAQAAYEWDHARQLLEIRMAESTGRQGDMQVSDLYETRFLLRRPLLQAIEAQTAAPVLLIDELDRTDEAFEAYLLELLSDFQMSIPELGTISALHPPLVILTSNRTRELHDAVKRRCLYQWVDFPDAGREDAIIARKVPELDAALRARVVVLVQALRGLDLFKKPGVAESIDFARALCVLNAESLSDELVRQGLGVLLKVQDDIVLATEQLPALLGSTVQ
ncbi:MAG: MoxR family ATPase [Betaproteobacteria bacterium]|nr:MoxR family ATPase [Pseudomonadota bacterium]NBO11657.1 MoxR family ATPase [Betaproteobacteria bacterium]NBO43416.1 MoxR family ATPase [Betaproteobacteria bacterium]NBP10117.1 MoxR family ATPase [Betaproteobacteria bacterium]NBP61238.1 MoxR family ATPase [Betaproteobacteria bacterium]